MKFFIILFCCLSVSLGQTVKPVELVFAGDLVLSDNVESYVGLNTGYVFEQWKPGVEADVFMVNLEHPITTATEKVLKTYNFKMNPTYLPSLLDAGITLVTGANNHIADYGLEGVYDTMRYLDSLGVGYVGIGKNLEEARRPKILEKRGITIGFLGYFGGGEYAATPKRGGFAPRYARFIVEDVKTLRPKVKYLVVNFHWGTERSPTPENWQIDLAHRVIDAGADLIVGHHPHVLQGIERYRGKYIAYSLGNFVFGGNTLHTYETAVLKVVLGDGDPQVELIPVGINRWQPRPLTEPGRERVLSLVRERSSMFRDHLFHSGAE